MKATDVVRVQAYLRAKLGSDRITLVAPKKHGASVEIQVGDEFLGTVHRDEDEGEVSFSVHMTILDEDLPTAAPVVTKPAPVLAGKPRR